MKDFMNSINETLTNDLNFNRSVTENGAIGYRTTGKKLLDLNFQVSSLRNKSEDDIVNLFKLAFFENKELALKWLFYLRDIRGGLGERRTFKIITKWMSNKYPDYIKSLIRLIPEYGRFDDILCLIFDENGNFDYNKEIFDAVKEILKKQFIKDLKSMKKGQPVSLLAKWLPSINASSSKTKKMAKNIAFEVFNVTEREYRKSLSKLRKYIDVVERKMSEKEWSDIKYETVPSKANLIYNKAFLRNDEERRREFLGKLKNGETKINSSVLYPYEIVHKYSINYGYRQTTRNLDQTLEELWRSLPKKEVENTIVVDDGSGSMFCRVGNFEVKANEVANSLAIYFAENSKGGFKDYFITFGNSPKLVSLKNAKSLKEKIDITLSNTDWSNTNIEKTFDLILNTAIRNNMTQEDLPKNVLIISDMEFDACQYGKNNKTLFSNIEDKFKNAGYKLPRLVFWNVCGRTGTIPVKENEFGVALISGFSINLVNMVMSNKTDPYECLLDVLMSDRYKNIKIS